MATRTIYAYNSSGNSGDLKNGSSWTYSGSTSNSGVVSGTVRSATLYISSIKTYASSWYLSIYVGGTKVAETVELSDKNSNSHSVTFELEYLKDALLTATGSIKFNVYNNNSSSANTCNFRAGYAEISVEYDPPASPTLSTPGTPTISQNSNAATFNISWSAASGSNGSGSITYRVWEVYTGDVSTWATSRSRTLPIPGYGTYTYEIDASYSGLMTTGGRRTVTFVAPSMSAPGAPTIGVYSSGDLLISWSASTFNYTTGSIVYCVIEKSTGVQMGATTSSTSLTITADQILSHYNTYGTTAFQFYIMAIGTVTGNTASGSNLVQSSGDSGIYNYTPPTPAVQYHTIKYYTGSNWTNCKLHYFDGTEWHTVNPHYYDGSNWIDCAGYVGNL